MTSVRFLLGLGSLLLLTTIAFLHDGSRRRRPGGDPRAWKLVVWFALVLGSFAGLSALGSSHPQKMPRLMTH